MKKIKQTIYTITFLGTLIAFSATNSYSQEASAIKVGGGLVFGSGVFEDGGDLNNNIGIGLDGIYAINESIRVGAGFNFYLPKSVDESFGGDTFSTTATVWELNLNGNYIFYSKDKLLAYGLAGVNITGVNVKAEFDGESESDSESETGLNLGLGGEYTLNFGSMYSELKLGGLGGDADQIVLSAGVRISI